ncbi:MAG: hypothetical protein GY847_30685 [Proteobacteria bacterium]|nr:hypothetical protein [Pseudomonadota bacterium]
MGNSSGNTADRRDSISIALTFAILGTGLYVVFAFLDKWAAYAFARPILASALIAVCDIGLFVLALSFAPIISRAFRHLLGRPS